MTEGYQCDSCGKHFVGTSPMSLEPSFTDEFASKIDKMNDEGKLPVYGDVGRADYCESCGVEILKVIGKKWGE